MDNKKSTKMLSNSLIKESFVVKYKFNNEFIHNVFE